MQTKKNRQEKTDGVSLTTTKRGAAFVALRPLQGVMLMVAILWPLPTWADEPLTVLWNEEKEELLSIKGISSTQRASAARHCQRRISVSPDEWETLPDGAQCPVPGCNSKCCDGRCIAQPEIACDPGNLYPANAWVENGNVDEEEEERVFDNLYSPWPIIRLHNILGTYSITYTATLGAIGQPQYGACEAVLSLILPIPGWDFDVSFSVNLGILSFTISRSFGGNPSTVVFNEPTVRCKRYRGKYAEHLYTAAIQVTATYSVYEDGDFIGAEPYSHSETAGPAVQGYVKTHCTFDCAPGGSM